MNIRSNCTVSVRKRYILESMENIAQHVSEDVLSELHLYDSVTRSNSVFVPVVPHEVSIYVCGATVQSSPHIGHMRAAVAFDVLRRWLMKLGYKVTFVRNVTDIDDKILKKAAEAGEEWWARAYRYEREFTEAYASLGVLPPTYEPRATGHMMEMIQLVQRLIDRGHAYVVPNSDGMPSGNVYFDVESWPEYGSLTHQHAGTLPADKDELVASQMGPSVDSSVEDEDSAQISDKKNPRDFALWKAAKPSEPLTARWEAPFGAGRPGWHLECSAMSHRYLGDDFDIHGGGLDLRFPHHENEMAQSRAAGWGFAHRWMHSAWVTQKGEKMSKSLGNGLSVGQILENHSAWVARYALASVHYRSMLEWSDQSLNEAETAYARLSHFLEAADRSLDTLLTYDEVRSTTVDYLPSDFIAAMNDDINVSGALSIIFQKTREGNTLLASGHAAKKEDIARLRLQVHSMLDVFGLDPLDPQWQQSSSSDQKSLDALSYLVQDQLDQRQEARSHRDFATADHIREALSTAGIEVKDTADGSTWNLRQMKNKRCRFLSEMRRRQ